MVLPITVTKSFKPAPGTVNSNAPGGGTGITGGGRDQWIRVCKVTLGSGGEAIDVSQLKCTFTIRQKDVQHPDWAYVRIYNLSEQTSKWGMLKEHDTLTIEAGYEQRSGVIYKGKVMQKKMGKLGNGTDKYFDVLATGNQRAYGMAHINKTLAAGHTQKDIVDACVEQFKKFGIETGRIDDLGSKKAPRAAVLHGLCKDILRDVAFTTNTSWRFHNEKFQMIKNDGYLQGAQKEIGADSGMIGLPEQQMNGIIVKTLLDAEAQPGMLIRINAKIQEQLLTPTFDETGDTQKDLLPRISADGVYRVYKVDHDGDTHDLPWYTTFTCLTRDDDSRGGAATKSMSSDFAEPFRGAIEADDTAAGKKSAGGA